MLRSFAYLDSDFLQQLVAQIDNGLLKTTAIEDSIISSKNGGADLKVASGKIGREESNTTSQQLEISSSAQFNRLLEYCQNNDNETGWKCVEDTAGLSSISLGSLVQSRVNISIPQEIKAISRSKEYSNILGDIAPFKNYIPGWNEAEMKDVSDKVASLQQFQRYFKGNLIIQADLAQDENAKYVGKLKQKFISDEDEIESDGYFIVGKVKETWGEEEWKQPLLLSGMDVFNREERRRKMSEKPSKDNADGFIEGPAALLQVLAIYY